MSARQTWKFPEGARATEAQLAAAAARRKTWRTSPAQLPAILRIVNAARAVPRADRKAMR